MTTEEVLVNQSNIRQTRMNRFNVFQELINYLNHKTAYSLLGASCEYPNLVGDIDFVVTEESFNELDRIIIGFCNQNGLFITQKLPHESTACYYVLSYAATGNKYEHIEIDFCSDYKRFGRLYFTAEELLQNREYVKNKGYWKLNDTYAFIYYLVKKTDKGSIDRLQFNQLMQCWKLRGQEIKTVLQRHYRTEIIEHITKSFDTSNLDLLNQKLHSIRLDLHRNTPKRYKDILFDKLRLTKRVIHPTGLVIGILGRDGVGKTTFSEGLIEALSPCFRKAVRFHLYPGLVLKHKANSDAFNEPHSHNSRSRATSFLKLNLFFLEYVLGYWIKIFPRKVRSNLVLFDRYFIDLLVDPLRYRNSGNEWIIKLFHYLIPKPDIWIVLDISSDALLKRKQEITYEMSESLRKGYLDAVAMLPNCIVINTEEALVDCVNKASETILVKMNERTI